MDILIQLIEDTEANPTKSNQAYALDVMQNDANVGRMWVRVDGVKNQMMLERISLNDYLTRKKNECTVLVCRLPTLS